MISSLSRKLWMFLLLAVVVSGGLLPVESQERDIYPASAQARPDLAAGLKEAATSHKRLILDFGGNWCGDCKVLDIYFHNPANRPILEANYVMVHINIGHMEENQALAERYQ